MARRKPQDKGLPLMFPRLGAVGPVTLYSYGLLVALGILISLYFAEMKARKEGFPRPSQVFDLFFSVILGGFLGGRIFYVIQHWNAYELHPFDIFKIWQGGLVFYGGVFGGFLGVYGYSRFAKISFLAATDFLLPFEALAHGFGRIGCFLNGCCLGDFCGLPWAVKFPQSAAPVHPVQLYEAFFNFGLSGVLLAFYSRRRFTGEVTFLYLIFYALGRFILEFIRGDQTLYGNFSIPQWISLGLFGSGLFLYGIHLSRNR